MSFSASQILFLQRLIKDRPKQRRAGTVSEYFCSHYSLGVLVGRFVEYREEHIAMASAMLRSHDLPVAPLEIGASRADVAAFGGLSEKTFSVAPHADAVAVKCVGGCTLNGDKLWTPPESHLVVTQRLGLSIRCDCLMVVENLETFRQLERYRWIDFMGMAVLVVFRGDSVLPISEAVELVRQRTEPIWAFVDFDPAGLVFANSLSPDRLRRLIFPNERWLREASNTARGRQLFDAQVAGCRDALNKATNPEICAAWRLSQALTSAVTQERMLHATELVER